MESQNQSIYARRILKLWIKKFDQRYVKCYRVRVTLLDTDLKMMLELQWKSSDENLPQSWLMIAQ